MWMAGGAVIEERDAYMARTLWAAATGAPPTSPAFVANSTIDGRTIFRYAMPRGGTGAKHVLLHISVGVQGRMSHGVSYQIVPMGWPR